MVSPECQCTECPAQHAGKCQGEAEVVVLFAAIRESKEASSRTFSDKVGGVVGLCFSCFDAIAPQGWEV